MYQLYYYPGNASFAPHLLLEELGLEYELILVDRKSEAQKSKQYLALNPSGRIPTLVHHDLVLFESAAICLYLGERHASAGFIPAIGSSHRPHFYQWLHYLTSTVQSELMVYFYADKHTIEPDMAQSIVKAQDGRLVDMFGILNDALQGKQYLLGDEISICDLYLMMLSIWADELSTPPLAFPNIERVLKHLANRPAVIRVCEKEQIDLAAYATRILND